MWGCGGWGGHTHAHHNTQHYDITQHTYDITQHTYDITQHTYDTTQHTYDTTQHYHTTSTHRSHRLDLTADPPMWSVLPGSLSTHGAPLLSHTWLQPGNAEASHDGQLGKVQRGIENGQQIKHHDTTVAYGMLTVLTNMH